MYNLKIYLSQEAQRYFRWSVIGEGGRATVMTTVEMAVSSPGAYPARPWRPCTGQRLTDPHQPGYREKETAVPPTPAASPSAGDYAGHKGAASEGIAGRKAARETVPRDASPSQARWPGRVRRHLHDVQR